MVNDLVSVIIPTYKTNNSLMKAIESVLNQSYSNIEVIVVDDNEPTSEYRKHTEQMMKTFEKKENVHFIFHETNMNGSAARNTGAKNAKGTFLAFLDDDDYFLENKIEKQLEFLKKNDLDFCTCYYYRNGNIYSFEVRNNYAKEIFLNKTTPQTSSFFIKKSCYEELGGFDITYFRHQDYEFLLRVCEKCRIGVLQEPLYVRDNNGVINVPNGEKLEKIKDKFLLDFEYLMDKYNLDKKKIYAKNYSSVFYAYIKNKNMKDAMRIVKQHGNISFFLYILKRIFTSIRYKVRG